MGEGRGEGGGFGHSCFLKIGFKRVRPRPKAYIKSGGSIVPGRDVHGPLDDWDPGLWRWVARRMHGGSVPGDRLDRAEIDKQRFGFRGSALPRLQAARCSSS